MLTDKINELREELNKQVISGDILHKRSILQLSQKLDAYIVEYLKNNNCKRIGNNNYTKK